MRRVLALFGAVILVAVLATPAAGGGSSQWHRVGGTAPDLGHERLTCFGTAIWQCRYDQLPEPKLDMTADRLTGAFRGTTVESCPAELGELCDHWQLTVVGAMTWKPADNPPFTWYEDLIVTDGDGVAPLYMYITGGTGFPGSYACPWYRSFQDALDAKLAFEADCIPI